MLIKAGDYGGSKEYLYSSLHLLDSGQLKQKRIVYTFYNLLGDMGGVFDLLVYAFIFMYSVSEQSFVIEATS
jgi:hypothetical protein